MHQGAMGTLVLRILGGTVSSGHTLTQEYLSCLSPAWKMGAMLYLAPITAVEGHPRVLLTNPCGQAIALRDFKIPFN